MSQRSEYSSYFYDDGAYNNHQGSPDEALCVSHLSLLELHVNRLGTRRNAKRQFARDFFDDDSTPLDVDSEHLVTLSPRSVREPHEPLSEPPNIRTAFRLDARYQAGGGLGTRRNAKRQLAKDFSDDESTPLNVDSKDLFSFSHESFRASQEPLSDPPTFGSGVKRTTIRTDARSYDSTYSSVDTIDQEKSGVACTSKTNHKFGEGPSDDPPPLENAAHLVVGGHSGSFNLEYKHTSTRNFREEPLDDPPPLGEAVGWAPDGASSTATAHPATAFDMMHNGRADEVISKPPPPLRRDFVA